MAGPVRSTLIARLALVAAMLVAGVGLAGTGPDTATAATLSRWTGGMDLYRSGVFTTQQTWLWCTAADIQIIRNVVAHQADHSASAQQAYFDYMRAHDRYAIPVSDGVDPAGWTAGLQHFVDGRYRLVASSSFDSALRSAVTNLRRTNLPVGITVEHGNHAWILTGFTATADPAVTNRFTVTSVRVVGPLWGLQNRTYGYDMRPDTKLTPQQLAGFFTPWHYARIHMAWENRWVSVQAVAATPAPTPRPAATTPSPSAALAATPGTTVTPPSPPPPESTLPAASTPAPTTGPPRSPDAAAVIVGDPGPPASGAPAANPALTTIQPGFGGAWLAAGAALVLGISLLLVARRAGRRRRSR